MSDTENNKDKVTRRDFVTLTASSMAVVGAACAAWPLVDSFNPSADVLALSSVEFDLSHIEEGQTATIKWRGKPVLIWHRTKEEIAEANGVKLNDLRDPQEDKDRVKAGHEKWLVVVAVCTHLGCVPLPKQGEFDGWFCPCHGSHYDGSGRIRKGPAPLNLAVPPYEFISDTKIRIG
jgi:ubiquinol-cytochrome c reductase iron-sulfur subunit